MKQEWVCDTSKGGIACGVCSSCKARADEKVLDYLERARQVLINAKMGNWTFGNGHNPEENHIIEIAKLLQREESK